MRENQINIRMNDMELTELSELCVRYDLSRAEVIRLLIRTTYVRENERDAAER